MKGYTGLERAATLQEQIVAGIISVGVGFLLAYLSKSS